MQSFFSRKSSKLCHRVHEDDLDAENDDLVVAEDQQATHALIIREVQLLHPIVFDTYNLCDMHMAGMMR